MTRVRSSVKKYWGARDYTREPNQVNFGKRDIEMKKEKKENQPRRKQNKNRRKRILPKPTFTRNAR
jgi:hypothetical protein